MRADYVSIIFIGRYGLKSTIVDGLTVPVNAIPCDTIMENIIVSFHIYIYVCVSMERSVNVATNRYKFCEIAKRNFRFSGFY